MALTPDHINNVLSLTAIVFSVGALAIAEHQRRRENRLTRRQDLTDTISELAKIQIAALELELRGGEQTEQGVSIRRVHNLQRRFYARLGTRLIRELPDRDVTEVDYNLLATASNESSDPIAARSLVGQRQKISGESGVAGDEP
jgi:hypothetical protein